MVNQAKSIIVKIGIIILIITYGRNIFLTTDTNLRILGIAILLFLIILAIYLFFGEKIKHSLPHRYVDNKYFPRLSITAFITLSSYLFLLLFSLGAFADDELSHGTIKYFLLFLAAIFLAISATGTVLVLKYLFKIKQSNST